MSEKPDDTATLAAATFPPLSDEQCAQVAHLLSLARRHNEQHRVELIEQYEQIAGPLRERYLTTPRRPRTATPYEPQPISRDRPGGKPGRRTTAHTREGR